MKKPVVLFLVAFAVGAAAALTARTALHRPYAATHAPAAPAPAASATAEQAPVNTICAVCGMAVDPAIPPAHYLGKTIGFGCGACPALFAADPERYGPAALQNKKAE